MSDFNSDYPSTETLSIMRKKMLLFFTGAIVLVGCRFLVGKVVLAIGAGVVICALGAGWLMANNPDNKRTGSAILLIGILVALSGVKISILPVITSLLLSIITVALFAQGIKYLFIYFVSQKKRN